MIEDGVLMVMLDFIIIYFFQAGDGICLDLEDQVQVCVVQAVEINVVNVLFMDFCFNEEVIFSVDIDNVIFEDCYEWLDLNGNELVIG